MPQHRSPIKTMRQIETRRLRNRHNRSKMKSAIKCVRQAENKETAEKNLTSTVSLLDKMAAKGIIHKNKAANLKSKLVRMVSKME